MHSGELIRAARQAKGLSAEQLAVAIDRGSMTVYRWEWGVTSPRIADLTRIAVVLGVSAESLYGASDTSPPSAA